MKKKRQSESDERNIDLYQVFRSELGKAPYPFSLNEVLQSTVRQPAKRFYISARRAWEIISDIRKGQMPYMNSTKKRMITELMKRLEIEEVRQHDKPPKYILEEIVDMPAPEFYLKPSSAKVILCNERKRQLFIQQQQIQSRNERIERRKKNRR